MVKVWEEQVRSNGDFKEQPYKSIEIKRRAKYEIPESEIHRYEPGDRQGD